MSRRAQTTGRVVNLCFHGVGKPGRVLEPDEELYWVMVEQFEEMIEVVARHASARVTFDDGNVSDASVVLPVLAHHGLTASFFLIADRIGQPGSVARADVVTLIDAGMKVGLHGMHHVAWRDMDGMSMRDELDDATVRLQEVAGHPIGQAACPFGAYDRRTLAALRRRGFQRVYTVDGGSAEPEAWLQSRYAVLASDTAASIERVIRSPDSPGYRSAARKVRCLAKRWR